MNNYVLAQISGVALAVLGGQGAIRLFANINDTGFLSWLPGDASLKIGLYVAITVAGGVLASWAYKKSHPTA